MTDIHLQRVSRRFPDGFFGLREVELRLPCGQFTTVLGPSGCGKTTLLRLLAGLDRPTAGRVVIGGRDVTLVPAESRDVGLLFQNHALFPHLDVLANVGFGGAAGRSARDARRHARQMLECVGLEGFEHRSVTELSGGQQQRVALARALAAAPSVLLLDEPLSGLEGPLRRQVREQIRSLQQRLGLTAVHVTHDAAEAMALSDVIVVMNQGTVVQVGTPSDVYERPVDEFVAGFMGDADVFPAAVGPHGRLMLGDLPLPIDAPAGQGLRVMVRPHAWRIHPAGREGLSARIAGRAFLGRRVEYRVDTGIGQLLVLCTSTGVLYQTGAPVTLTLASSGVVAWSCPRGEPAAHARHILSPRSEEPPAWPFPPIPDSDH